MSIIPPAVNFHLVKPCNDECTFCYAQFDDDDALKATKFGLPTPSQAAILDLLATAGCEKITFVGGEPTLHKDLPFLLRRAQQAGMITTLVTNGLHLARVLDEAASSLDWVGLSVNSGIEEIEHALRRGTPGHVARSMMHTARLRELGIRIKLNTVVTALNVAEDMSVLVLAIQPQRWKIFQVLPVVGQNDGAVESLLITKRQFDEFVARHQRVSDSGIAVVPEDNDAMTGTYAMIDPLGRFFCNTSGRYVYSKPILEVGVEAAFEQIQFSRAGFEARGGHYDYSEVPVPLTIASKG